MAPPLPASGAEPVMSDEATFPVGPPQPVTDSRDLPAVTAEDEAKFVHGADLGAAHPDNKPTDSDDADVEAVLPEIGAEEDEDLPSEDELDSLVAHVDPEDVDSVGFDDADLGEPLETGIADGLDGRAQTGGS
jgi:hypothetical protein